MGIVELIDRVRTRNRLTLTEAESKMILRLYNVPVVEEAVATDWEETLATAQALGYPVVLKGLGARLTHKTERGLVAVNLRSHEELRQAYDRSRRRRATTGRAASFSP
jgi:acyl-CoA synthetase (NDP forming)